MKSICSPPTTVCRQMLSARDDCNPAAAVRTPTATGVAWKEARKNSSKMNDRRGNVYENKGPQWKTCARGWNVIENKDSYALEAGISLKRKELGGR